MDLSNAPPAMIEFLSTRNEAQLLGYVKDYIAPSLANAKIISTPWEERRKNYKGFHGGLDVSMAVGTPLQSIATGTVAKSGYTDTSGNYIIIEYPYGYSATYMHLRERPTVSGTVRQGQVVAFSGDTGRSGIPHAHIEWRKVQPGSSSINQLSGRSALIPAR